MLVVLGAGVLKLFDLPEFGRSLSSWNYLPRSSLVLIAFAVPIGEFAASGLWFSGAAPRLACRLGIGLLLAFTLVYAGHLALGEAPECRCFGKLSAYADSRDAAWVVIIRNTVLMLLIVPGTLPRKGAAPRRPVGTTAGFTLIETILVVAIIGLLLTLVLPSLSGARDAARRAGHLSRLRQHATVFTSYGMDWDDYFPAPTDPDATYTVFYPNGEIVPLGYFDVDWRWTVPMAPYYEDNALHPSFYPPGDPAWYGTLYAYSCSFLADPLFWNATTRAGPGQWRGTRVDEVLYPSLKGLFVNRHDYPTVLNPDDLPPFEFTGAGAAFVDTSAEFVKEARFRPWYPNGEGPWPGRVVPGVSLSGSWVRHTIDGVRGRDVASR